VIINLCRQFGALPSVVLAEDVRLLHYLAVLHEGTPQDE